MLFQAGGDKALRPASQCCGYVLAMFGIEPARAAMKNGIIRLEIRTPFALFLYSEADFPRTLFLSSDLSQKCRCRTAGPAQTLPP
ncbi:Transcription repressor (Ovate family protein) [Psidium guajava]|nr:Transcription repressor (Ovate family protein) [Psidium guajava]